jgi:hypothetical protein
LSKHLSPYGTPELQSSAPQIYSAYDDINSPTAQQNYVGPAEYRADIAKYLASLEINPPALHSLDDLMPCTKSHPEEGYPARDIEFWEKARAADDRW